MYEVELKLIIPVIDRSKFVSALDCGFTVIGELKHKFNEHEF
jgi:hypothetical protein